MLYCMLIRKQEYDQVINIINVIFDSRYSISKILLFLSVALTHYYLVISWIQQSFADIFVLYISSILAVVSMSLLISVIFRGRA